MITSRIAPKTDGLIRDIVYRELSRSGIAGVEASVGEDHEGDEAIIVEVIHDVSEPDLDPGRVAELMMAMNRELYAAGEHRFAYVYNRAIRGEPSFGSR